MSELEELRGRLDAVDAEIVAALNRRFEITDRVRALKRETGLPPVDERREREILERVCAAVPPAHRDTACSVFERILSGSRGFIEVIARGICIADGKALLCRTKGAASSYLPGGHVEFGESARDALVREIREELGIGSSAGRFLGAVENSFDQHGQRHCEINLVYELGLDRVDGLAACEDWISFEWCPLAELERAGLLPAAMISLVRA